MLETIKHEPPTLAEFFGLDKIDFKEVDLSEYAHVIIDVQREFADPTFWSQGEEAYRGTPHTLSVAQKIAEYTPKLREAGLTQIFVYFEEKGLDFKRSCGGPFLVNPDYEIDTTLPKTRNDAFISSTLQNTLKSMGKKKLLISGFNARACIRKTVESALRRGFQVALLCDGIGQDQGIEDAYLERSFKIMEREGALRTNSDEAIDSLEEIRLAA